ncbi:MAG: hypothetical protein R6U43_00760 [Candidatus Krumholzibacteriales bacterium]
MKEKEAGKGKNNWQFRSLRNDLYLHANPGKLRQGRYPGGGEPVSRLYELLRAIEYGVDEYGMKE